MRELEGLHFKQMVDPDPIMTYRDTELDNGGEVLSQLKPKENKETQPQKEQICSQDTELSEDVEMFSQSQNNESQGVSSLFSELNVTQKSSNHSQDFIDFMNKTVLHHNIPYWNDRETRGDGNCFYNAIIDQI